MTTPGITPAGFDDRFFGVEVGLPAPVEPLPVVLLGYTHFSMLLRPDRRLAAVTGVGIDGATLLELDRAGIDWAYDPRVPVDQQTGPTVYAGNDFDRGHLVRRRDPVWGDPSTAARANATRSTSPTPPPRWRCSTRTTPCGSVSRTTC